MAAKKPDVAFGPCCFCDRSIAKHDPDPCRITVETAAGKWQVWFCHGHCFRDRLAQPPEAPSGPVTIAGIWNQVRERCGESSAASLAEIDALLNYLSNYAYPFERVGKNSWKWGVGHPAAARRWES